MGKGEVPTVPTRNKVCMVDSLPDIDTHAKFQIEIFRGYDFTMGQIFHFPIDFCMGLTTMIWACDIVTQINV